MKILQLTDNPEKDPTQAALGLEIAVKEVLRHYMGEGLTVTGAVGTLELCKLEVANSFFKNCEAQNQQ